MSNNPDARRATEASVLPEIEPVVLEGRFVRLEPLSLEHVGPLSEVALDAELWRWIPFAVTTADEMHQYVEEALEEQRTGSALPFATVERASGRVVGSTRYGAIVPEHRRLEIGWTFVAKPWQRSAINSEAKLLMLTHAFDVLGMNRVELKTDSLNERSRSAIAGIGATQEGIFRNHIVCADGRLRHSVYFSVVKEEWPEVESRLEARVERLLENDGAGVLASSVSWSKR